MNIVPKLNQNKHPKDCTNLSLVDAKNIMFDVDQNSLSNDNKLVYDSYVVDSVKGELASYLRVSGADITINIVGSINCNKETVYFLSYYTSDENDKKLILLRRYDYTDNPFTSRDKKYLIKTPLDYHDGEIIGTFTYNRNNELIIAFSEYKEDNSLNEPLRTFNLDDIDSDLIHSPLVPEVRIPQIDKYYYIRRSWYKGQNHVFISFKISEDTYTQWYDLHTNIYTDMIEDKYFINAQIHGVKDNQNQDIDYNLQEKITLSDRSDICDVSFALKLTNINFYSHYRLAIINVVKNDTKTFVSYDIPYSTNYVEVTTSLFRNTSVAVSDIIQSFYNYYNAKELINYKNKLFISNFKEEYYDNVILEEYANRVNGNVYTAMTVDADEFINYNPTFINTDVEYFIKGIVNNKNYYQISRKNITCDLVASSNGEILKIDDSPFNTRDFSIFADVIWLLHPFTNNNNSYVSFDPTRSITSQYINGISTLLITNLSSSFRAHFLFNDTSISDINITNSGNDDEFPNSNLVLLPLTKKGQTNFAWYLFRYINSNNTFKLMTTSPVISFNIDGITETFYTNQMTGTGWALNTVQYDVTPSTENQEKAQLNIRTLIAGEYYQFFIHYVNKYGNVSLGFPINVGGEVSVVRNLNDEKVYKINENSNAQLNDIGYSQNEFKIRKLKIKDVKIPDGYIGWFISYAQFEGTTTLHGLRLQDSSAQEVQDLTVDAGKNAGRVLSLELDILDKINMNNNIIEYLYDNVGTAPKSDEITNFKLVPSNSPGNMFRTSYIKVNYESYNEAINEQPVRLKKVPLDSDGRLLLYLSKVKSLIPLSYIYYEDANEYKEIFVGNYNGVISKFEAIEYKTDLIYDAGDGSYRNLNGSAVTKGTLDNYIEVHTWYDYSTYFNESKRYRSNPQIIVTGDYDNQQNPHFTVGVIAQGRDIIDLFENNQLEMNENYPKVEMSYYELAKYKYIFDQTIRRSNVIADESLENSWRKFETDQYINIKENKGNIMNLCAIGNIFLVHTEHSLFQFDFNDRLTSNGGVVEVDQKDIFESRYTELFNTELGFGGLQERRAAIAGDFGYIWFNNDFNHFFALSKEGPKVLSEDIDARLKLIKPKNVRFGDDKQRSRLLIRYENGDTIETISFNYKLGCFVSMHDYNNPAWFAYTKDRIFVVNTDKIRVGHFNSNKFVDSQFSIIVNYSYDEIKFLEYLSYKFTRITDIANLAVIDFVNLPVEGRYVEESGNYLYVVSDKCRTGQLVLKRTDAYDNDNATNKFRTNYPYFELGYFNMNKLVNINGKESRMFGNYFVFTFVVNTTNENKINFESFECSLTKIRR